MSFAVVDLHACITLNFSRPGKPTDNAFIESFNSHFRPECLALIELNPVLGDDIFRKK